MEGKTMFERLRVRSNADKDELNILLVMLVCIMPYMHYVPSSFLLIVTGLSVLAIKRTRALVIMQKEICIVGAAIVVLSGAGAAFSGNVIGLAVTLGIFLIFILLAYLKSVMTPFLTRLAFRTVGVGGIFTFVIVIIQRISERDPGYRPTGWQWNANYLGAVSVLSAMICLLSVLDGCGCDEKRLITPEKCFFTASLLCNCASILICESRSSLLGLMACVAVILLLKKRFVIFSLCAVLGASVWALGYFKPELFGWANSLTYVFTQRFDIWMDAFRSFSQGPTEMLFGRGPMTYRFVWEAEGLYQADHAHNILFDTLINVGVVGLFLYLALLFFIAKDALKGLKEGNKRAFAFTAVALTAVAAQGTADVTIMWHQTALLFVLMCGARPKELSDN